MAQNVDHDQILYGTEGDWPGDTGEGWVYHSDLSTVPEFTKNLFHLPEFHSDPSSTPGVIVQPAVENTQPLGYGVSSFSPDGFLSAWDTNIISSHGTHSYDPFLGGTIGMPQIDFTETWEVPLDQTASPNQNASFLSNQSFNEYGSFGSSHSGFQSQGLDGPIAADVFHSSPSSGQFHTGFLYPNTVPTGWMSMDPVPESMSRTMSNASFQTANEEPFFSEIDMEEPAGSITDQFADMPSLSVQTVVPVTPAALPSPSPATPSMPLPNQDIREPGWIFEHMEPSKAIAIPNNKKGRRGPLKEKNKKEAALMRVYRACDNCKQRKTKCNVGIACTACIHFYKCGLIHKPCRGQQLAQLASILLTGKVFPRERSIGQYMQKFNTNPAEIEIELSLGFGVPMKRSVMIVYPVGFSRRGYPPEFVHEHVVYPWPTKPGQSTCKETRRDYVFPAVLAKTHDLKGAIDEHLTLLLDDQRNFEYFPLFNSPLKVLRMIYVHYIGLPEGSEKALLRQALKLLILIHIGGDTFVVPTPSSQEVITTFFSHGVDHADVTPCFIRGQLGPVFADLALEKMKLVLKELEFHCLSRKCQHFPLVISTFAIIFMGVESIQYHSAKEAYHANYDAHTARVFDTHPINFSLIEDSTNIDELLNFYKACFSGCHRDSLLSVSRGTPIASGGSSACASAVESPAASSAASSTGSSSGGFDAGVAFVAGLKDAVDKVKFYLHEKSRASVSARSGDMTVFFDRLLAKLFLLEV